MDPASFIRSVAILQAMITVQESRERRCLVVYWKIGSPTMDTATSDAILKSDIYLRHQTFSMLLSCSLSLGARSDYRFLAMFSHLILVSPTQADSYILLAKHPVPHVQGRHTVPANAGRQASRPCQGILQTQRQFASRASGPQDRPCTDRPWR